MDRNKWALIILNFRRVNIYKIQKGSSVQITKRTVSSSNSTNDQSFKPSNLPTQGYRIHG